MKLKNLFLSGFLALSIAAYANPVVVKMNAVSTTMSLSAKESGKEIELPQPVNKEYELDLDPGQYILTGIATDGKTKNGEIVINVTDSLTTQTYPVITCTAYVTNKGEDGKSWSMESGDYVLNVKVNTREGVTVEQTHGKSTTAGRYTFLALTGHSYTVAFEPSELHRQEGFMTLYRGGTLTANVNVSGTIPTGGPFSMTVPEDANLQLGIKFTHFTDFTPVSPDEVTASEGGKTYRYTLANNQVYNYRTWKDGGLTHGGYFTMNNVDQSKCPVINFTDEDYGKYDPKAVNHDVNSNKGYETGDLLLNINPEHHLRLKSGEEFLAHGMRMWETTDNSTNNYFFEPDFHYTVFDSEFRPTADIIEIENADTNVSAWSKITAKGKGTAIVLVTYDGMNLNYYNGAEKKEYLGGEYWGAIWPENTGVFVVTVDEEPAAIDSKMTLNEDYNMDALRLAGNYVDAEHDVFYYLHEEEGFSFTFSPEGVTSVAMASPDLTSGNAVYSGFTDEGVIKNEDGSYTLLLKEGRNIVKMTDAAGRSAYQVLRAKPCHREITNLTREGSTIFQPGDKVKIQYSGLFHPANKIAGIYNMSAYVTYNGVPNGSSLILGSGQYTFGSAPSAQAVTIDIPENYDLESNPFWVMDQGVIQVNGYGDPIGNHRNTSPVAGRSPNFTAVPHKTYFGSIPDIRIPLTPMKLFDIVLDCNVPDAEITLTHGEKTLAPSETDGHYSWTYGTYNVEAKLPGYRCFRGSFTINEGDPDTKLFEIAMVEGEDGIWDGKTVTPVTPDSDGIYHISSGAELAYLAQTVAELGKNLQADIVLDCDIDLGDYEWSPIGASSSKPFAARFNGQGHCVNGLYINRPSDNLMALFGYVAGTTASPASITDVIVCGKVAGSQNTGGLVGNLNSNASIERCGNGADVTGKSSVGGLAGYVSSASASIKDCYNLGNVGGTSNVGGITGYNNASAVIEDVYSVGVIDGGTANSVGACVGSTTAKTNVRNAYAIAEYTVTEGHALVTEEQMASGEVAYLLGQPFSQRIGKDKNPIFGSSEVLYDETEDVYYNIDSCFALELECREINLDREKEPEMLIKATHYPPLAVQPAVKWTAGNEDILSVEHEGTLEAKLRAVSDGKTVLRIEHADNPEVFDECDVCVSSLSSISDVLEESAVPFDVYDLEGRLLLSNVTSDGLSRLAPGIYILRSGSAEKKLLLTR